MTRDRAERIREIIEAAAQSLPDDTALEIITLHPEWAADTVYPMGYKVKRGGALWRCRQDHTSQDTWEPENAASLWEQINETHAGTLDDPIPYDGNMALESGKHYIQDGVIYRCIRDTEVPVYSALSFMVGLYVENV